MTARDFIKENFVLVVGLALPVLLVAAFLLASIIPQSAATPPQYEMLFTTTRYDSQSHGPYDVDFFVKDGRLKMRAWKAATPNYNARKKLMAYNGKTQSVREIPYDLSGITEIKDQAVLDLDAFRDVQVDSSTKAPDGYTFENGSYNGDGIILGLFGGGYHGNIPRVTNGAAAFKIPDSNGAPYNYYDIQFVGWIIPK